MVFIIVGELIFSAKIIDFISESHRDGTPKVIKYYETSEDFLELILIEEYHENLNLKSKTIFRNNLISQFTSYHENGNIFQSGRYKDGEKSGKWIEYSELVNQKITKTYYYLNGDLNGKYTVYLDSGETHTLNYKDNKIHSDWHVINSRSIPSDSLGRPVLYNFSGHADRDSRWIEKNILNDNKVREMLSYFHFQKNLNSPLYQLFPVKLW